MVHETILAQTNVLVKRGCHTNENEFKYKIVHQIRTILHHPHINLKIFYNIFPKLTLNIYRENAKLKGRKVSKTVGKAGSDQWVTAIYAVRGAL